MKSIYIGNMPYSYDEEDVREHFEQYGDVNSVKLIFDKETQRPKGYGFVEMEDEEAGNAVEGLNGTQWGGRTIKVNEANPRKPRFQVTRKW
ncbi:MAG: RNA-binding protein [Acidobacteriota bacterium]|nr:RNA-binding protein [Acidobacteriota bacterium]